MQKKRASFQKDSFATCQDPLQWWKQSARSRGKKTRTIFDHDNFV